MKLRYSYKIARNVLLIAIILGMLSCRSEVPREPMSFTNVSSTITYLLSFILS